MSMDEKDQELTAEQLAAVAAEGDGAGEEGEDEGTDDENEGEDEHKSNLCQPTASGAQGQARPPTAGRCQLAPGISPTMLKGPHA